MKNIPLKHLNLSNVNKSKSGGVIFTPSDSCVNEQNYSIHTCRRLFARLVQRAAFVVSFTLLLSSCGNTLPSPSEQLNPQEENSRGTEGAAQDSTNTHDIDSWGNGDSGEIIITSDNDGWEDPDNVNFDFGA